MNPVCDIGVSTHHAQPHLLIRMTLIRVNKCTCVHGWCGEVQDVLSRGVYILVLIALCFNYES